MLEAPQVGAPVQIRKVPLTVDEGIGVNDWFVLGVIAVGVLVASR